MERKLYKDPNNKVIAGVCSGLGNYLGVDVTIMRILFVAMALLGGPGLLIYIILALIQNMKPNKTIAFKPKINPTRRRIDFFSSPHIMYNSLQTSHLVQEVESLLCVGNLFDVLYNPHVRTKVPNRRTGRLSAVETRCRNA